MRMELRVCKHCYDGTHNDPRKAAITRDIVACTEQIKEYKEALQLDGVYVTMVEEGDAEGAQALPAFVATLQDDQVRLADTQLVMEDPDGNMLVYTALEDILELLTENLDQIGQQLHQDLSVDLSSESEELVST